MVRVLILSLMIATLGAGALDALLVFFLQRNLHTDLSLVGVFVAAVGAGAILGALIFGKFATRIGLKNVLWSSLLGLGILLAAFSRLSSLLPALFIVLLGGALIAALNVAANALIIGVTPKHLIGRVEAVAGSLSMFSQTLSVVLSGYLASVVLVSLDWQVLGTTFRAIDTIYMGTGLLFFLSGLYVLTALPTVKLEIPREPVESQETVAEPRENVEVVAEQPL